MGNDHWSFYSNSNSNNSDCQNKLGCRGNQIQNTRLLHLVYFILHELVITLSHGEVVNQYVMLLQVEKAVARIKRSGEDETLDQLVADA